MLIGSLGKRPQRRVPILIILTLEHRSASLADQRVWRRQIILD
ncbi:MAG: hypothetical protein OFPII_27960 [Osedax symbiont Rs1]|nr:MAG: hypothetical protein OFPII_27960 [Osedax symbiont Rs1]